MGKRGPQPKSAAPPPPPKAQGDKTKRTPTSAFDPAAGANIYEPEKAIAQRLARGVTLPLPPRQPESSVSFPLRGRCMATFAKRSMQPHWSTRSLRLSTLTELLTRNWPFASADRFCHPVTWWEKYTVYGYYGSLCCAKYLPKYLAST